MKDLNEGLLIDFLHKPL